MLNALFTYHALNYAGIIVLGLSIVHVAPLSYTQVINDHELLYRDNYYIVINLVCNNHDKQYIK